MMLIEDSEQLVRELVGVIDIIGRNLVSTPVSRVGLFLQFLSLKATMREVNAAAVETIPDEYRPKLEDEEDFVLQINKAHVIDAPKSIRFNHLIKWSVERFKMLNLQAGPNVSNFTLPLDGSEQLAASVAFDLNNAPLLSSMGDRDQAHILTVALDQARNVQKIMNLKVAGF